MAASCRTQTARTVPSIRVDTGSGSPERYPLAPALSTYWKKGRSIGVLGFPGHQLGDIAQTVVQKHAMGFLHQLSPSMHA